MADDAPLATQLGKHLAANQLRRKVNLRRRHQVAESDIQLKGGQRRGTIEKAPKARGPFSVTRTAPT